MSETQKKNHLKNCNNCTVYIAVKRMKLIQH
jgi:hypothetical protein